MGSSINVNVGIGFGGLPAIDKEQRNNMRFVKLEKDGKSLVYSTSLDKGTKVRTTQGQTPDGKPKPSTPEPVPLRDEPAAFRHPGAPMSISWFSLDRNPATRYTNTGLPDTLVQQGGTSLNIEIKTAAFNRSYLYNEKRTHQIRVFSGDGKSVGIGQTLEIPPSRPPVPKEGPYQYTYTFSTIDIPPTTPYIVVESVGTLTGTLARSGVNPGFSWKVFPSGNGNCIIIAFTRYAGADVDITGTGYGASGSSGIGQEAELLARVTASNNSTPGINIFGDYLQNLTYNIYNRIAHAETTAWSVNNKKVRQIIPPQYILDLNPPVEDVNFYPNVLANPVPIPDYGNPKFDNVYTGGFGPVGPEVFRYMNNVSQFIDPSQINSAFDYPYTNSEAFQRNNTKGIFATKASGYLSDLETYNLTGSQEYYYKLKQKGQTNYLEKQRPDLITFDNKIPMQSAVFVDAGVLWPRVTLLETHDGGDPDYCKRMLLAMGFSPADLRP